MEYAVEDDVLDLDHDENFENVENVVEEPIYQPMMKNNYSFYPGFRTRLLSCIEENDTDSHKSLPYDFMIEADESFKELIDDNEETNEWEGDDIATLNESEIYKIESMEAINHCGFSGQPQEVYWQTPTKAIPSIMTASCYGILPGVLHHNGYVEEKKEEPIYAVPDKRGRSLDFNTSFDSSACQSQASSIYGGEQPYSSMTSSLDFNGRNVSSPMEMSIISNDGQKLNWNDGDFDSDEKGLEKINDGEFLALFFYFCYFLLFFNFDNFTNFRNISKNTECSKKIEKRSAKFNWRYILKIRGRQRPNIS